MGENDNQKLKRRKPVLSAPPAEARGNAPASPSATPKTAPAARHEEDKPSDAAATADQKERIPGVLPILPIRDSVAYPGTIMPLSIGRDKSKRLIEQASAGDKMIGVIAQRRKETEDPGIDDLYRVGTACAILKVLSLPDGTLSIIVHGLTRFGLAELVQTEPFLLAQVQTHDDPADKT
ncbi:MAG: LON peptidase substrate-binding domain-containing protein, partial [Phycisphaerae bacterium]|nr:LON peptidase substrate-binding domain-containing protein [Phycisphaerae bacterium]